MAWKYHDPPLTAIRSWKYRGWRIGQNFVGKVRAIDRFAIWSWSFKTVTMSGPAPAYVAGHCTVIDLSVFELVTASISHKIAQVWATFITTFHKWPSGTGAFLACSSPFIVEGPCIAFIIAILARGKSHEAINLNQPCFNPETNFH